jgi:DNA (cytosine-5)-methyltransferase 1
VRYASVCDGIGAVHCAWQPLGWRCAWSSEIDKFPIAVVEARHPSIPNLGDMTAITQEMIDERGPIELLVGGTPCQSFSVAGLRGGLDDARGNLALRFMQLCAAARPRWVVWENVPGVLSVDGGRAFGSILCALEELGYGWAYRTLDAQWFGVAQRRRRVFVVGCLGDWRRAAAVLFERESVRGDPPTREAARQGAASSAGRGASGAGDVAGCVSSKWAKGAGGPAGDECYNLVAHTSDGVVADPITTTEGKSWTNEDTTFRLRNCVQQAVGTDCYNGAITGDVAATIGTPGSSVNASGPTVMETAGFSHSADGGSNGIAWTPDGSPPIRGGGGGNTMPAVMHQMAVRRLTPRECERLQGFPDDYTLIPWRKKPAEDCPDGPRYRALGNSMAVPVMRWIGERIAMVDAIEKAGPPRVVAGSATTATGGGQCDKTSTPAHKCRHFDTTPSPGAGPER